MASFPVACLSLISSIAIDKNFVNKMTLKITIYSYLSNSQIVRKYFLSRLIKQLLHGKFTKLIQVVGKNTEYYKYLF